MPNTAARRPYVPESAHVARAFLDDLRSAHRNLIARMEALDRLARGAIPDPTVLSMARWKLGQASLSRRLLTGRICEYFLLRCDGPEVEELVRLQQADRAMLRLSAEHLGKWTMESIARDWPGYCRAGTEIRRRTHDHIALEQRLLYPLLEQVGRIAA